MKSGSFCSGVAGLDVGANKVFGAEPAWFCEKDEAAAAVLAARFPGVPNHGDLKTFDWSGCESVDVLTMGFPCQPFSAAGRQLGTADHRHLFPLIVEAMEKMARLPEWVVVENVPRLVTIQDGEVWAYVQDELMRLGYAGVWRVAPAASVGAPHLRKRVVLVARRSTTPVMRRSPITYTKDGAGLLPTPRASDGFGAGAHGDGGLDLRTAVALLPTPTTSNGNGNHVNSRGEPLLPGVVALLPTPRASDSSNGGPNQRGRRGDLAMPSVVHGEEWGKYGPAIERWEALTRPAPAPRTPTGKGGALRLSSRFVEWMVGLPEGWVTGVPGLSNAAVMRCLGNIVVPQFAGTIVAELRDELLSMQV